jgi:hypothetical protein
MESKRGLAVSPPEQNILLAGKREKKNNGSIFNLLFFLRARKDSLDISTIY